ncbi:hypothetical protein PMZ80_009881 [Knufia obscura]|uniref:Uncharacterized protein n=2 Tax=Knufia TaxID=430999 RepID=A0AAN8EHR2_9EURO|nr:hypothetical protein PMZ80_009881 [Knufia obscura]KAK5955974.1 hypothetical protein OHC33_002547 [Knufia fluminis]
MGLASTSPVPAISSMSQLIHPEVFHPQAPREGKILGVKDELLERKSDVLKVPMHQSKSITPPPKYDVQHQATCFFLNLFSFQASKKYGIPILDFLPDMLNHSAQHTAIYAASKAVSRVTLADRYSGKDIRLQTGHDYAKALKSVSHTMSNESEAIKDETVTAVWLLGLYEAVNSVLSHGRSSNTSREFDEEWKAHIAHMRGAMRLLRLRGDKQFENPRSEKIFRIFKAAIQMRLFVLNSVTSSDFDYLEVDIYKDENEFVPSHTANIATAFFHKVARHLEATKYALQKFGLQPHSRDLAVELDQLLYEGECLDAGMLRWSKQEPGWDMMQVQGNVRGTMWALYPFHAQYYFYSFWVFLYWLRFLIARIKLYETLIEIEKAKRRSVSNSGMEPNKPPHWDARIESFTRVIQRTANDLIGLTAYALGDVSNTGHFLSAPSGCNPGGGWNEVNVVAAMQLVIPLKVLQRSPYCLPEQKGAIDLAITHIADGFRRQPIVPEFVR